MKNNSYNNFINIFNIFLDQLKKYKKFQSAIKFLLLLMLITFFGYYLFQDWNQLRKLSLSFNFKAILLAFGLYGLNFYLLIIGWHLLLRCYSKASDFKQNVFFYSYSHLYRFLPTPAWFLTSRVSLYGRAGIHKGLALNFTLQETLLHMLTGLMVYGLISIEWQNPTTWFYAIASIPTIIIIQKPNWLILPHIRKTNIICQPSKYDLLVTCMLYVITWIIAGPFFIAIINIVHQTYNTTLIEVLRIWILGSLIAYIGSYTLGGAGILREFSLLFLLSKHFNSPMAVIITVLVRFTILVAGIIWALVTMGFLSLKFNRIS